VNAVAGSVTTAPAAVGGLVLAAGPGSRLGAAKATVELGGRTFLERSVALLHGGGCRPVIAVVGAVEVEVPPEVSAVHNPAWREGQGSSLRVGLAEAARLRLDAVVVLLVDQPELAVEAVERHVHLGRSAGAEGLAQATYGGRPGHPVLLGSRHWSGVSALAVGDAGARPYLAQHRAAVTPVACDGLGSDADIDTAADLAAVRERLVAGG
jgi:nicotine blue oxidoreductase